MADSRKLKRLKKPILYTLAALLILVYLIWGRQIASFIGCFTGVEYSKFPDIFGSRPTDGIEVHMIDVGQAESLLIRTPDGNILIDAGTNDSEAALQSYLDACRVRVIDYFICTHPHDDHIGGADMILDSYKVKRIIMSGMENSSFPLQRLKEGIEKYSVETEIPEVGDSYTLGGVTFTVIGPLADYADGNDMSLVLRLTYGETVFLFTGDITEKAEADLISAYSPDYLDCDFYKIAHHGANTASSAELLKIITPEIAAVSAEHGNDYGHPRGEVLARLRKAGCETVLRTDTMGTCVVFCDGETIRVIS